VDPQSLFARQAARSRWFVLLIGTAAAGGFSGLHFCPARLPTSEPTGGDEIELRLQRFARTASSHIASVRLMAEIWIAARCGIPPKQREYYKFIVQECRRLGALIENVLDFARIEQGRKEYDPQPTDVGALLQQSVKLLEPRRQKSRSG
jgi:signal transduction histidine kinase